MDQEKFDELVGDLDEDDYDVDMLRSDYEYNNFSDPDEVDKYRYDRMICRSIYNGQRAEARETYRKHGCDLAVLFAVGRMYFGQAPDEITDALKL